MPAQRPSGRGYPARSDPHALTEDLAHATSASTPVGEQLQRELATGRSAGAATSLDTDDRDQTSLPNCVKAYLPAPDGASGVVFEIRSDSTATHLALLAFGRRHLEQPWQPSVYQIARRRRDHQN